MQTTKQQWLALFEAALARREQEEAERNEREWHQFFNELLEQGRRLRAPPPPRATGLPGLR